MPPPAIAVTNASPPQSGDAHFSFFRSHHKHQPPRHGGGRARRARAHSAAARGPPLAPRLLVVGEAAARRARHARHAASPGAFSPAGAAAAVAAASVAPAASALSSNTRRLLGSVLTGQILMKERPRPLSSHLGGVGVEPPGDDRGVDEELREVRDDAPVASSPPPSPSPPSPPINTIIMS